jgi:biofilm PGA synthesis N-glycosyltransferase PgaC
LERTGALVSCSLRENTGLFLMFAEAILILLLLVFAYPFVIYPLLLKALVRSRTEPAAADLTPPYPSVALVICALNEEKIIRQKIENSLTLQFPRPLHIVVISDGSTDATASIAREYAGRGIDFVEHEQRRGKVANLNAVVSSLAEDVIVFSDANVIYEPDAIFRLATRLQDPTVGCVSGKVVLVGTVKDLKQSEENYYSLEWSLQKQASLLYSMVGADGAMYALRRKLFRTCPDDTIIEDMVIPAGVIRQGYRVVFEQRATAWESGITGVGEEFRRKTRIAAGAAQAMLRGSIWPWGAPARYWFIFVSHKLLRWLSPIVGLWAILLALGTHRDPLSQVVLAGFAILTALALLRSFSRWSNPLLDACFYFLFGQVSLLWGLMKGAAGKQSVLWVKLNR